MKQLIVLLITSIFSLSINAQNLITNGDFESAIQCPIVEDQVDRAAPWFRPTLGSSDYFNSCAGNNCLIPICVPGNQVGYQAARSGVGYCGFGAYTNNGIQSSFYSEYISSPLSETLEPGAYYEVVFYLSLADSSSYAYKNIGVYFSEDQINNQSTDLYLSQFTPQIMTDTTITDKIGWSMVRGCYRATGNEDYITIGSFDTVFSNRLYLGDFPYLAAYYYIDDVSITKLDIDTFEGFPSDTLLLCETDSITLSATTNNATYLWQDGTTDDSLVTADTGAYWVEVTAQLNCRRDRFDLQVINNPSLPTLQQVDSFCLGSSLSVGVTAQPKTSYEWNTGEDSSFIVVSTEDTFTLTAFNTCDTTISSFQTFLIEDTPFLNLIPDSFICLGDTLRLEDSSINPISYLWQDGSTRPYFLATQQGDYSVEITTLCWRQTFSKKIQLGDDCACVPFIPNSFSPNEDRVNETFNTFFSCPLNSYSLSIYDKYGKLNFRTQDPLEGWDGTFKEESVNAGVYVFYLHVTFPEATGIPPLRQTGNITLIR